MNTKGYRPDKRLNNIEETHDQSPKKDTEKLVEVKKKDTSEDQQNDYVLNEKPFDEQMFDSFEDVDYDEEAD